MGVYYEFFYLLFFHVSPYFFCCVELATLNRRPMGSTTAHLEGSFGQFSYEILTNFSTKSSKKKKA